MASKKLNIDDNKPIISQEEMDEVIRRANFERQRKMQLQHAQNELESMNNRARSVSVGTAFGGAIDLSLRRPDGVCTYAILQPVEAVELLHQLAASVGCHLHLQPRKDFASWRIWANVEPNSNVKPNLNVESNSNVESSDTETKKIELGKNINLNFKKQHAPAGTHPPHPEYVTENWHKAREMPKPENQPGLNSATMAFKDD
jgi:hypothetical protein